MRRRRYRDGDDDILRDGDVLRVPLMLMDSLDPVQQAVGRSTVQITDGQGGTQGLHRPGFRIPAHDARKVVPRDPHGRLEGTFEEEEEEEERERHGTERQTSDDAMRARDAAYRDYELALTAAYAHPVGFGDAPSITGFGERGSVGQREGGTGMLDCEENAEDIVPDAAQTELARRRDHRTVAQMMFDHQNKMTDIYDKLDHELSEAWRRP